MSFAGEFSKLLTRFGGAVILHRDDGSSAAGQAFLQPLSTGEEQSVPTLLGRVRTDRFLYLGAADLPLPPPGEGYLTFQNTDYEICTASPVLVGGETTHWRAVLALREEATP